MYNELLIKNNISEAVKKVGKKYFIHFDNAAFYKNNNTKKLIAKTNGIRSYSQPGNSLDNRPIEYFFSILKQEYLRIYQPKNIYEAKSICNMCQLKKSKEFYKHYIKVHSKNYEHINLFIF